MTLLRYLQKNYYLLFAFTIFHLIGCEPASYTLEDFKGIKKIDAHVHINSPDTTMLEQARIDNFKLLTINVDYPDFAPVEDQYKASKELMKSDPEMVAFASTFYLNGWDNQNWQDNIIKQLDSTIAAGAVGVKIWKNIGMVVRDRDGNLIMADNPAFDPIFKHVKEKNVVLISHAGEPRDCWLPADEMMVKEVGEYFEAHPEYYMYVQPEMPSYEEQMEARDRMLDKNKDVVFMGAHLASLEWSVDRLAGFLDKYPNAVVDMSARMAYVKAQTIENYEKVRQFFIKYQDRVLYATDLVQDPGADPEELKKIIHNQWFDDWKFLATDLNITDPGFDKSFKGLHLPKVVIDKIYSHNAQKTFPKAWR